MKIICLIISIIIKKVEQDHRGIKRITRPMLSFKSFYSARRRTLAGIELTCLRKGRCLEITYPPAEQFYALDL